MTRKSDKSLTSQESKQLDFHPIHKPSLQTTLEQRISTIEEENSQLKRELDQKILGYQQDLSSFQDENSQLKQDLSEKVY